MTQTFDIIVIGSGTAAQTFINEALKQTRSIALIENDALGGVCALKGCQAKKFFVTIAEAANETKHLSGHGLDREAHMDWPAIQAFKRTFTGPIPENTLKSLEDKGVTIHRATARFNGNPHEVIAGDTTLTAKQAIIIANGARPRSINIEGAEHCLDSDDFLDLETLPKRIAFIGGGYISCEFASMAQTAGATIDIIQSGNHILGPFDPDMTKTVEEAFVKNGINLHMSTKPERITKNKDGSFTIHLDNGDKIDTDLPILAIGRVANTDTLNLGSIDIEANHEGIPVNDYAQSEIHPHIYAIGDAANHGPMLATTADYAAKVLGQNLTGDKQRKIIYDPLPSIAFCTPNIASVGLSEKEFNNQIQNGKINQGQTTGWPNVKRHREEYGAYKILIDIDKNIIVGAHLVGLHSTGLINLFTLAIKSKVPLDEMQNTLWAYPTLSSDIKYMIS